MTMFALAMPGQPRLKTGTRCRLAAACLALLAACSSPTGAGQADGGRPDGSMGSGGGMGTGGSPSASGGNSGSGGLTASGGATATGGASGGASAGSGGRGGANATGGAGGASGGGEFGFTYRQPGPTDVDWLCTFRQGGVSGHVYARLNQTGTKMVGLATVPVYATALAQISVGGAVTDLANTEYDHGGGHHNDSLRFDHQGKSYKYYHSSFGFGFRSCQPMDCINVYTPGGTTPDTDGCTSARALPEICVRIKSDGTHDPLTDRFMKCPGDSAPAAASLPSAQ